MQDLCDIGGNLCSLALVSPLKLLLSYYFGLVGAVLYNFLTLLSAMRSSKHFHWA